MTMWKPLIVCAVAALALTGCASSPTVEAEKPAAAEETKAAPLEAAPEPDSDEARYLNELKKRSDVETIANAEDAQLLEAGRQACQDLQENPYVNDLQLIEGETPRADGRYFESSVIGTHAQMYLCPDVPIEHQKIG